MPQHAVAHAAPGRVAHLAVLQMKPRVGEAIEIAGVVVMQMGDDHVANGVGRHAEIRQRVDRIERELARARLRLFGIEAGIDQDVATAPSDQPDEIIEVQRRGLVRIGGQEIHVGGARRHRRIAQRVDFVGISHRCHLFLDVSWMRGLADPGNKPLSSAKVKPGRERRPHDSDAYYVRRITLPSTTSSARCELDPRRRLSSGSPNSEARWRDTNTNRNSVDRLVICGRPLPERHLFPSFAQPRRG